MPAYPFFVRSFALGAALAGFSLTLSQQARAQQLQALEGQALEGIVVEAAALEPVEAAKLGSAYTVITGEELERRQIRHAADALRTMPGLSVNTAGGRGNFTQLRIRGGEANHAVILIDGVEVNSLDAGDFDFATLLAADIERIEVIRGPQSGVYGSNALAGVVNIVTRKGRGPARASASAEYGSFNSHALTANASAGSEKGHLSVSAAAAKTDGFNLSRFGSDDEGSEQKSFFTRGGVSPSDVFRVDFMLRYQRNRNDINQDIDFDGLIDDTPGDVNTREQRMARISAELDTFGKSWTHKVFADYLQDDFFSTSQISEIDSSNLGTRGHFGYQSTMSFGTPDILAAEHKVTGLAEQKNETISTAFVSPFFTSAGDAERRQTGFVAEYQGTFARDLTVIGNVRRDLNDSFDDTTTWRLAGAYMLPGQAAKIHTSYGTGVTNPTFFEQFGFGLNFRGNPDLTPEEAKGWDFGVERSWWGGRLVTDVTYFQADLLNEIVGSGQTVVNLDGESERSGVELSLSLKPADGLIVTGSYTYTDSSDPDGVQEIRRPKHAAALNAGYSFAGGRGQIDVGLVYNGEMKDTIFAGFGPSFPTTVLDEYFLVNIAASYKLDDRITLFGRVQNLLDAEYEELYGFASAPVGAYAGVKLSFQDDAPLEAGK